MDFVSQLFISIITGYLAFTNGLAIQIDSWLNTNDEPVILIDQTVSINEDSFITLPTQTDSFIPDILLRSVAYQQAALSSAGGLSGARTKEPLEAIVNIFCTLTTDSYIRTTTGTGFFIDPDGVIITNAHVAQFLLFEDSDDANNTKCVIRSGNPAAPKYHAELLFISPAWITSNSEVIHSDVPMGTGERDYALLYVSSTVDNSPLPAQFPALSFDTELLPISTKNNTVVAAGYPATKLFTDGASTDLIPKKSTTTISELYTFGSNYADVFSIRGSSVGAEGASGGPVLNEAGDTIGIIVTRGDDSIDGTGSLRAITISHIERTIKQETGFSLAENLSGNLVYRGDVFAETLAPFLVKILQQ